MTTSVFTHVSCSLWTTLYTFGENKSFEREKHVGIIMEKIFDLTDSIKGSQTFPAFCKPYFKIYHFREIANSWSRLRNTKKKKKSLGLLVTLNSRKF